MFDLHHTNFQLSPDRKWLIAQYESVNVPPCTALGACCFPNRSCLELSADDCDSVGATWRGPGTDCADGDGSGVADDCEVCAGDVNGDGATDARDLALVLGAWGVCP